MKKILLLICVFIPATLCIAQVSHSDEDVPDTYKIFEDSQPKLEEEATVYLGDRMLVQRLGHYEECLRSKKEFQKNNLINP